MTNNYYLPYRSGRVLPRIKILPASLLKTLLKTRLLMAIFCVSILMIAAAATAATNDELTAKIDVLEAQLNVLQSTVEKRGGVGKSGGTEYAFGGYIKLDAMWTDMSDGKRPASVGSDFLVPSLVAVGGEGGDAYFDAHAKHSRIWFKTTSNTEAGVVKSYIEADFNSTAGDERLTNQNSGGLRHAFLSWDYSASNQILAGQTWSTFFNVAALPEAVDFIGPTSGTLFVRQAQIRWTKKLDAGRSFMLAFENPSTGLNDGGGGVDNNNIDDNSMPDLVARYNGVAGNLNYSAAVMLREIAYDNLSMDDKTTAIAVSLAGIYKFTNGDDIKLMVNYGPLGRYIALNAFRDGVVEADGDIELIDVAGGFIAYRHLWSKQWRSTVSYASSTADNPDSAVGDLNKTVSNASINLLYSPSAKLTFGTELIYADREVESGLDGDLRRLQFMGKLVF